MRCVLRLNGIEPTWVPGHNEKYTGNGRGNNVDDIRERNIAVTRKGIETQLRL
ncbi:hypothetical protein M413DRAFT_449074 [Hebeloma cylindrosporum]|uniref:Uncharacterized protein n=1 Tax=Hebeloma cylindrosporum TaxID=76867 RepID=A0A0C3BYJ4_HEBCY|nr:hypothetical protein M413DRAFT_449074 [Hebeloma cylindrosporum h7]